MNAQKLEKVKSDGPSIIQIYKIIILSELTIYFWFSSGCRVIVHKNANLCCIFISDGMSWFEVIFRLINPLKKLKKQFLFAYQCWAFKQDNTNGVYLFGVLTHFDYSFSVSVLFLYPAKATTSAGWTSSYYIHSQQT